MVNKPCHGRTPATKVKTFAIESLDEGADQFGKACGLPVFFPYIPACVLMKQAFHP